MENWLPTLITATPGEGYDLAVKLARIAVKMTQPDAAERERLRPEYARNAELRITDTVTNEGSAPVSPELLYHFNLGYPAIGPGSTVALDAHQVFPPVKMPEPGDPAPSICIGGGAALAVKTPRPTGSFDVTFRAATGTLPALQFWRDLRPGVGLFCVEPCTSPPGSHSPELAPGEHRTCHVTVSFRGMLANDIDD